MKTYINLILTHHLLTNKYDKKVRLSTFLLRDLPLFQTPQILNLTLLFRSYPFTL